MPLRSSTPVNVDDDDGINNTKPAATEPNDGMVDRTPSATLNVAAPVTQSPNDCLVHHSNQSPSSLIYRPLEKAPESPTDSVMVHYHETYVSSPNASLENNNDDKDTEEEYDNNIERWE